MIPRETNNIQSCQSSINFINLRSLFEEKWGKMEENGGKDTQGGVCAASEGLFI